MTRMRLTVLTIALLAITAATASGQGTSGSQFLGVGVGGRAMGMGGAYVSVSDDPTALYWNPAGLTRISGHRVTVSHLSWLSDASYQYASYARELGANGAVGVAVEQGSVAWDNTGAGDFEAGDFAGVVGYGRRIRPNLGVGGGLKMLSSSLGDSEASSFAVDLGAVYSLSDDASLGIAVRNLGPGMTFEDKSDPLPTTMTVGGSYRWRGLLFAADLEKVNDLSAATRLGAEYSPAEFVALRGGFILGDESVLSSFTGGIGINWKDTWALDYAYRDADIGETHQFALSAGFGGAGGAADASSGASGDRPDETPVPKSHLSVLSDLAREVADEAVTKMRIPDGSEIHLKQVETHDANWLVKSVLVEELTSRGHVVRSGSTPPSAAVLGDTSRQVFEVGYRIVSCNTSIPRSWREWVVGRRMVERRSAVDIRFELSDRTKAIVWAGGVQRERREIIDGSRLRDLASQGQSFATPEFEPGGWDKIFEPVIVAGIVGGLIYLFYTSRSTD
jgi:hypothetical protein